MGMHSLELRNGQSLCASETSRNQGFAHAQYLFAAARGGSKA